MFFSRLLKLAKGFIWSRNSNELPRLVTGFTFCVLSCFSSPTISSNAKSVALLPSIAYCKNESPT